MDTEQIIRIALTVATPILTAGIGIVALVVGDWRERRTRAGRRKLSFEDATRQVEFASDWYTARKLITPDEEQSAAARANAWLEEASALVTESKPPPPSEEKRSITLRRLLLAYPMHRRGARVLRGFYYFFLGVTVFQISGALGSAFGRADTLGVPNYFSGGLIYQDLLGIVLYTLIAMAFRFWSLRVEESQPEGAPPHRMTLRDVLLAYRFNGIRAHIARTVYWLWLALAVLVVIAMTVTAFQDPRSIPANLVVLVAWLGWAVGLRYWAVSHSERAARQRITA
ncbi:MAG TPA: hypothetical protein VHT50_17875 [Mycobacterium sp.]|nr:hypothetical protein [Mycobacterium sp.]